MPSDAGEECSDRCGVGDPVGGECRAGTDLDPEVWRTQLGEAVLVGEIVADEQHGVDAEIDTETIEGHALVPGGDPEFAHEQAPLLAHSRESSAEQVELDVEEGLISSRDCPEMDSH